MKSVNSQRGSSFIEVLVATLVVSVAVVGIAVLMMFSINNAAQAKYRERASSLAQGGLEIVHKDRAYIGWPAFENKLSAGGTFCFDTSSNQVTKSCGGDNQYLSESGTTFNRRATITSTGDGGYNVEVIVSWDAGNFGQRQVAVEQDFYNIY